MTSQLNRGYPKAFVCGWPIEHSKSPLIHSFWLEQYGLTGSYEKQAVAPEDLAAFIEGMVAQGWVGGNVTIPHKETVSKLVSRKSPAAEKIGAINTLWFERGELVGDNTDWVGFAANLDDRASGWDDRAEEKTALVIGAGGAARGILYALLDRKFSTIRLANRTRAKAEQLAGEFGPAVRALALADAPAVMADCDLVVNTSSMGMQTEPPMPDEIVEACHALPQGAVVNDIVYVPMETALLRSARMAGRTAVDGLGMLLHQAVPGFEKWFGKRPEVTEALRNHVLTNGGKDLS